MSHNLFTNFPKWIDPETASYMRAAEAEAEEAIRQGDDPLVVNEYMLIALECLTDPNAKNAWLRARKFYPGMSFRGQIFLLTHIWYSYPLSSDRYLPSKKAEKWKSDVIQKLSELIELLDEAPANYRYFETVPHQLINISPVYKKLANVGSGEFIDSLGGAVLMNEFLEAYINGIREAESDTVFYGMQTSGEKSKKVFFIRSLSSSLKYCTNQWKREIVAILASIIFKCECSASDVVRTCKGLSEVGTKDDMHELSNEEWYYCVFESRGWHKAY